MSSDASNELLQKLQAQVDNGLKSRREKRIKAVFETYCDIGQDAISLEKLGLALRTLNVQVESKASLERVFKEMDMDHSGTLDYTEFCRMLNKKSSIQQWASTQQLDLILADAIPTGEDSGLRTIPANSLSQAVETRISLLSKEEIDAICMVVSNGLRVLLSDKVEEFKATFGNQGMATQLPYDSDSGKYHTIMNCGSIDNFHNGLEGRVGHPHTKFRFAMKIEHTIASGHDHMFTTSNYNITTAPRLEWSYVAEREGNPCPEHQMRHGRRIPDLEELKARDISRRCGLTMDEIISIVLYTGPMVSCLCCLRLKYPLKLAIRQFFVYNSILRRSPEDMLKSFQDNSYSTTILVLASAVRKLSRVAKFPEGINLYRGMAGCDLPSHFANADENGCHGFAEWAFMSTTEKKEIALQYSGAGEKRPNSKVFVISTSSVDRGARVQDFSQYPAEKEYIWPPLSFVQRSGPSYLESFEGTMVTMIPVKVNSNLKIRTVEEIVEYKKKMHITTFTYLLQETRRSLNQYSKQGELYEKWRVRHLMDQHRIDLKQADYVSFETFRDKIMKECEDILGSHSDSHEYSSDDFYKSIVVEMLNVKQMALSKLELYLLDQKKVLQQIHGLTLKEAHRDRICLMHQNLRLLRNNPVAESFRKKQALELCKMLGLVTEEATETNNFSGEPRIVDASFEGWNRFHLELLLECKADFTTKGRHGMTPIIAAAQMGHIDTMTTLVEVGRLQLDDLNCGDNDGWNGIMHAVMRGNIPAVKKMIELKADPALPSHDGRTAFMYAAIDGDTNMMEFISKYLSNEQICRVDYGGHDALYLAGSFDQYNVLEWAKSSSNTAIRQMWERYVKWTHAAKVGAGK